MGDDNPIYIDETAAKAAGHPGIVAPPAMIQVWTMMGLGGVRPDDDPIGPIMELFDNAGYIGVVATNCEQTYHRYLRPGEDVSVVAELIDVVGPKQTALGEGYLHHPEDHLAGRRRGRCRDGLAHPEVQAEGCRPNNHGSGRSRRRLDDAACVVARYEVLLGRRQRTRTAYPEAPRRQPPASAGARAVAGQSSRRSTTSWRAARARCSASSCTTPRRCPAARCRS